MNGIPFQSYYDTQGSNNLLNQLIQAKGSAGWGPIVQQLTGAAQQGIGQYQQNQNTKKLLSQLFPQLNQQQSQTQTQSPVMGQPTTGIGGVQSNPMTKNLGGQTYINIGGQWYQQ